MERIMFYRMLHDSYIFNNMTAPCLRSCVLIDITRFAYCDSNRVNGSTTVTIDYMTTVDSITPGNDTPTPYPAKTSNQSSH